MRSMQRLVLMLAIVIAGACAPGRDAADPPTTAPASVEEDTLAARTPTAPSTTPGTLEGPGLGVATTTGDQSGNRLYAGRADLTRTPIEVMLEAPALWVVGAETGNGVAWVVTDADGNLAVIARESGEWVLTSSTLAALPAGMPPTVVVGGEGLTVVSPGAGAAPLAPPAISGGVVVSIARGGTVMADDQPVPGVTALEDGRIVVSVRGEAALLADPTDRLRHGVLGDQTESETVVIVDPPTASMRAILEAPDDSVFEALAPMWADLDGDGSEEVVVTASDDQVGARMIVYSRDGEVVASTDPIGRGNRWLNQLAAGPVGPDGEIELVEVRTPHIGGIVRWYALVGNRLELQAEARGYSTHSIGSRNLDLGIVADANGDDRLEVVVPTQDRTMLVALQRVSDGAVVVAEARLGDRLSSNLSAVARVDGTTALAAGTEDGKLLIWP